MKKDELRFEALKLALDYRGREVDIADLFRTADNFVNYIQGQNPHAPHVVPPTHLIDLARAVECPVAFAEHCMILHPIKGAILFDLYNFQKDLLRFLEANRLSIVLNARQMGITTTTGTAILRQALLTPDSVIAIVGASFAGARETLDRIGVMYENLPDHMKVKARIWNKSYVEFENGSKIIVSSYGSNALKGRSISMLVIQDAAYFAHSLGFDFWHSISPTLSKGARCIIHSSAGDTDGIFYRLFQGAPQNGFEKMVLKWDAHPDRDEAWKQPYVDALGEKRFRGEFECEFIPAEPVKKDKKNR